LCIFIVVKGDNLTNNAVFRKIAQIFLFVLILSCLMSVTIATTGTVDLKVTETNKQDFYRNGTIIPASNVSFGYIQVFVENINDVLQYTRLNISNLLNTNVGTHTDTDGRVWNMYRGAAANGTRLLREGDYDTYDIAGTAAKLNLNMSFSNIAGGIDIYNNDNIWDLNNDPLNASYNKVTFVYQFYNPSNTSNLTDVTILICFQRDMVNVAPNDFFNIIETLSDTAPTSLTILNSDGGDTTSECATWTGNVTTKSNVIITLNATTMSGLNFDDSGTTTLNLNGPADSTFGVVSTTGRTGTRTKILETDLLSEMNITAKYTRASVRQGVDMALENQPSPATNTWQVRGFFKNPSNDLNYTMHEWRIYEVNPATGQPKTNSNKSAAPAWGLLIPGITKYTGWFDTEISTGKPYFASYFDWEVNWTGTESYDVSIKSRLDMGVIYEIDTSSTKTLAGILLPESGMEKGYDYQRIYATDITTHIGDTNTPVVNFTMYAIYPYQGMYSNGTATGFINMDINCSSVKVYANQTNITSQVTITCLNTTDSAEGYVLITSPANISTTAFGAMLKPNDFINVTYMVLANESMYTGIQFNFTGNITFTTNSGTPLTEAQPQAEISVTDKRLVAYKDLWIPNYLTPTLVNASIRVDAFDKSDAQDGIAAIKVLDYVVNGTDFNISKVIVKLNGVTLVNGTSLTITDKGIITLSDGTTQVHAYEYAANTSGFWNGTMYDGYYLTIEYQFNITNEGTYSLPTEIVGLDPATGKEISASALGVIKVDLPEKAIPFEITDEQLKLVTPVITGNPGVWTKTFSVYNPNKRPMQATFKTTIFGDSVQFYATYYDALGNKVEEKIEKDAEEAFWQTVMAPLETRMYEIRVMTPPILEADRKVEVLEKLEDKKVKLKMDIYLKSFAKETYTGIKMRMPISYEKIMEIQDAFGNKLAYNGGTDSITIDVPDMEPESVKTITIIYKESYPAIIVTTDKDRYNANNPVGMSILVINGGETLTHSYLEAEVYDPNMDTLETSLIDIGSLEPLAKTETTQQFLIPMSAPTGMYVANVRFREDFATISQGVANFYVLGSRMANLRTIEVFLIVLLGALLVGLTFKRAREVKKSEVTAKDTEETEEKEE